MLNEPCTKSASPLGGNPAHHHAAESTLPDIVYCDASLLVLNKPAGLLSVPGRGADKQDCLSRRVQALVPDALVVHRLDMATSGLLLMARGPVWQRALSMLFAERLVHKRYVAVVQGLMQHPVQEPDSAWQTIDLPIAADWPRRPLRVIDAARGKPSQTRWRVLATDMASHTTRLELEPITGRSHQLRVHLQALGHPIVGDALYDQGTGDAVSGSSRLLLHASALAFTHPATGDEVRLTSEPPF
jgi:tRNA pseudouridine32 synthase / 23S rRNA pseudouridine746 synthase